jgi:photosystem II stability/assembly factor-like uncharacterized protein
MLAVDPTNPNIVWANGDHSVYRSADGGVTWTLLYLEDPVGGYFDAAGAFVLVGDLGIHRSPDQGNMWNPPKMGNLEIAQFYDITLDPTNPTTVYGIAQDIGAMKFTGGPVWTSLGGGDEVGKVLVDPTNPSRLYNYDPLNSTSFIQRSDDAGFSWINSGSGIDTSQNGFTLAYDSQKAFVMDPTNSSRLILGTDKVYETTNAANTWTAISGVLSTNQFLTGVAIAPSHPSTLYASTSDGKFFVTTNDGTSWSEIDSGLPGGAASAIVVDPANSQHVLATLSGGVWMSANGGASWTNLSGNLPVNSFYWTNTIAVDWRYSTPVFYVGTGRGIYRSLDTGTTWAPFGQGMPNTDVTDLEFVPGLDLLAASTLGRGAFEILVAGPPTHLTLTAQASATAGSPFSVTLTGLDALGNQSTAYTGTVHFTSTDSGSGLVLPGNYTFGATDYGTHTFTNGVTLVTVGNQTITATDTISSSVKGSATVTVGPASASHFSVVLPNGATAGSAFNFTVTALDPYGNTATGYTRHRPLHQQRRESEFAPRQHAQQRHRHLQRHARHRRQPDPHCHRHGEWLDQGEQQHPHQPGGGGPCLLRSATGEHDSRQCHQPGHQGADLRPVRQRSHGR